MKDIELYHLLQQFFMSTIELLKGKVKGKEARFDIVKVASFIGYDPKIAKMIKVPKPTMSNTSSVRFGFEQRLRWHPYWHEIESLTELTNLSRYVAGNKILSDKILIDGEGGGIPDDSSNGWLFSVYLSKLLNRYADEGALGSNPSGYYLKDEVFDQLYAEFENYLYSKKFKIICYAPLPRFQSELEVIKLEENLRIRKLSDEERKQLWYEAANDFDSPFTQSDVGRIQYIIEAWEMQESPRRIEDTNQQKLIRRLLLILNLLKDSPIVCEHVWTKLYPSVDFKVFGSSSAHSTVLSNRLGTYSLSSPEAEELKQLWKQYRQFKNDARIHLALNRIFSINYETGDEDKLIDCWIGLEALFNKERKEGGIGGRVGQRVSKLLGSSEPGVMRKQINKILVKSYECRKAIVHGEYEWGSGTITAKDGSLYSFKYYLKKTVGYLRLSMKKILFNNIDLDSL